jgi:hypothetical protein
VKFFIPLAIAGVAIWFFSSKATSMLDEQSKSPQASIENVNDILERASSGKPLDGRPTPDARWVRRMNAACEERDRSLNAVPRTATAAGIANRGKRILVIHRSFATRVAALRAPGAWKSEAREVRAINEFQQRVLARVVAAALSGDLGRATQEAVALRELAGSANTVFMRLGLDRCVFGSSGMPL